MFSIFCFVWPIIKNLVIGAGCPRKHACVKSLAKLTGIVNLKIYDDLQIT